MGSWSNPCGNLSRDCLFWMRCREILLICSLPVRIQRQRSSIAYASTGGVNPPICSMRDKRLPTPQWSVIFPLLTRITSISILQFRINIPIVKMLIPRFHNRIGKVCALVATALILPALAYAGGNNNDQGGVHTVPEGGPGIVLLITTFGAILLFSARRSSRAKT